MRPVDVEIRGLAWRRLGLARLIVRSELGKRFLIGGRALAKQLLDPADRVTFFVQKTVDPPGQLNVVGPIIAAVAGALQRPQLRELGLPIAKDVLGDPELLRQLADRLEGARSLFAGRHRHA